MTWVGDTYKHCGVKRNTTQIGLKYLNQFNSFVKISLENEG